MKCPCINCVAPKRYPGCHDHCPEKAEYDKTDLALKKKYIEEYMTSSRKANVFNTKYSIGMDRRNKKKGKKLKNYGD